MQRLINEILERAKADRQRIVLPEGTEERTLKAANQILTDGIADLILWAILLKSTLVQRSGDLVTFPRQPLSTRKTIPSRKSMHNCCSNCVRKRHDY